MQPIYIRQRLRPSRYAFIVDEAARAALQAASLNAVLWGGIRNPIVPLTPVASRDGLLKAFDPDGLVNLTGVVLPEGLAARFEARIVEADDLVRRDDRTDRREIGFGFNILPLLRHVYEKEVRFSPGPTRATMAQPQAASGWPEFAAFVYGSFGWLPEMDVSFGEAFRRALRARTVDLPELTPAPDYESSLFPLDFTGYGLRLLGGDLARLSSHVIYIGDYRSLTELVEFWNIRATGRTVTFVPTAAYRKFETEIRLVAQAGRYAIYEEMVNRPDLLRGPSVPDVVFEEVCVWVKSLGLGQFGVQREPPRFGVEIEKYGGDIQVAGLNAAEGEEISILQDGQMTPVKVIAPSYLADDDGRECGKFTWSVEVSMIGGYSAPEFMFAFPNEPAVEAIVRRATTRSRGEVRLGRRGLVLQENGTRSTLHLMPVPTKGVLHALLGQAGLEAKPSQPGQYAEQIIKKMGSLHGDCRVLKIRGVRGILDRLGKGSALTKCNINDIVRSQTPDDYGLNWRPELYEDLILRQDQQRPLNFTVIFDVLLEKHVLRPGFVFDCPSCSKSDWYHVSEFAEEYTCRFCYTPQRVYFGSRHEWLFKADGLFQIPDSVRGSVAVILSLWRFEHLAHGTGRYVTSRDLVAGDTQRHYEIDYAYVVTEAFGTPYDLVLGEAKGFIDLTDEDIEKMAELADRFPHKPYLAFSTLKDRYSDAEKSRLRDLAAKGYRVIALTREELDPYDLYDRFNQAPHRHVVRLEELSQNTLQLNVGD